MYVNDDGSIGKEYKQDDGSVWRVNDARHIETFERTIRNYNAQCNAYHQRLMEKGVKAYRCNDGWVDRKKCIVTFFSRERTKGYYWGNLDLKVGDKIFIGSMHDGGRFAEIISCEPILWSGRSYAYKPLEETFEGWGLKDGKPFPFITKYNAPRLSLWDRIRGKKMPRIATDIYGE